MLLMIMKFIHPIKRWLKIKKIVLTNWLYKSIGTRVRVEDIVEDLYDIEEVWREFTILLGIWELTKFKKDLLSVNRLEACIRALIRFKNADWKCSVNDFQKVIEGIYFEKVDLYEDTLFTEDNLEIQCIAEGARGDVAKYFLFLEYLFKKEIKQD